MPEKSWWGRWPSFLGDVFDGWVGWVCGIGSIVFSVLGLIWPTFFASNTQSGLIHLQTALWIIAAVAYLFACRAAWEHQWNERTAAESRLNASRPRLMIRTERKLYDMEYRFLLAVEHGGGEAARCIRLDQLRSQRYDFPLRFEQIDMLHPGNPRAPLYSFDSRLIPEYNDNFNCFLRFEKDPAQPRPMKYPLTLRFEWGNHNHDFESFELLWDPSAETLQCNTVSPPSTAPHP